MMRTSALWMEAIESYMQTCEETGLEYTCFSTHSLHFGTA